MGFSVPVLPFVFFTSCSLQAAGFWTVVACVDGPEADAYQLIDVTPTASLKTIGPLPTLLLYNDAVPPPPVGADRGDDGTGKGRSASSRPFHSLPFR
jgi:hypothetical protein